MRYRLTCEFETPKPIEHMKDHEVGRTVRLALTKKRKRLRMRLEPITD